MFPSEDIFHISHLLFDRVHVILSQIKGVLKVKHLTWSCHDNTLIMFRFPSLTDSTTELFSVKVFLVIYEVYLGEKLPAANSSIPRQQDYTECFYTYWDSVVLQSVDMSVAIFE